MKMPKTRRIDYRLTSEFCLAKRSILQVVDDDLAEFRAVSIARVYAETDSIEERTRIRDKRCFKQRDIAQNLAKGVRRTSSLKIMYALQVKLSDKYRFEIWTEMSKMPTYKIGPADAKYVLMFLFTEEGPRHSISVITSLKGLLCKKFQCPDCFVLTHNRRNHSCRIRSDTSLFCNVCKSLNCRQVKFVTVACKTCKKLCNGQKCLSSHKCRIAKCDKCQHNYLISAKRSGEHVCGENVL